MYRQTADSCPDGPCPKMATDDDRGTTALQGYDPAGGARSLDVAMGAQPPGEFRIEMRSSIFESMLAEHLSDDAVDRILAMRSGARIPA